MRSLTGTMTCIVRDSSSRDYTYTDTLIVCVGLMDISQRRNEAHNMSRVPSHHHPLPSPLDEYPYECPTANGNSAPSLRNRSRGEAWKKQLLLSMLQAERGFQSLAITPMMPRRAQTAFLRTCIACSELLAHNSCHTGSDFKVFGRMSHVVVIRATFEGGYDGRVVRTLLDVERNLLEIQGRASQEKSGKRNDRTE